MAALGFSLLLPDSGTAYAQSFLSTQPQFIAPLLHSLFYLKHAAKSAHPLFWNPQCATRIQFLEGDVIIGYDDRVVAGIDTLHELLAEGKVEVPAAVAVTRRGEKRLLHTVPPESRAGGGE